VKCEDVQLHLGGEPGVTTPELEAHLRECPECVQYQREMQELDGQIRRAMMIDLAALKPDADVSMPAAAVLTPTFTSRAPPGSPPVRSSFSRSRHWALAASVLLGVALVLVMWGALPRHSLAADVVSHVVSETIDGPLEGPVDEAEVRSVMERSGLHLDPINPSIVFVRTCFLRGRLVPHFIVRTEHGDATVMIMPREFVKKPERFDGAGYKGVIVPDEGKGAVILLSRQEVDLDRYVNEIRRAVHMLPPKKRD
jgi:hypothetical protein